MEENYDTSSLDTEDEEDDDDDDDDNADDDDVNAALEFQCGFLHLNLLDNSERNKVKFLPIVKCFSKKSFSSCCNYLLLVSR
jgi:hypothetical protein